MTRLALVIPNLTGGGAARVACILCSAWAERGIEVHLLTFDGVEHGTAFPVGNKVIRHHLGQFRSNSGTLAFIKTNILRLVRLRSALRRLKPDAVISFLLDANVVAIVASRSLGLPVLVSERNHPAHDRVSKIKGTLRRLVYPRSTRVVVQTEDIRRWFTTNLGIDPAVIPNPVELPTRNEAALQTPRPAGGRQRMISLGRLEPQKGFDRLIDAFALVASAVPEWDLVIYGEGAERERLEGLVERHGLTARVRLAGVTRAVREELRASDLYVHAARYEGYPNALIEALSEGLCVVATDCPGATGEVLGGGTHGLLVRDQGPAEIADGLRLAISDEAMRLSYAAKAREAVAAISPGPVAERWLIEFERCTGQRYV